MTTDTADIDAVHAKLMLAPGLRILSPSDRQLLTLRYFEGLTQSQIADRLEISQMTVSRRLTVVLDRLRKVLGPQDPKGEAA